MYKVEKFAMNDLENMFNKREIEGWEAVHVIPDGPVVTVLLHKSEDAAVIPIEEKKQKGFLSKIFG